MRSNVILSKLFLAVLILLGGCNMNSNPYDKETIIKAKEATERYLDSNYSDVEDINLQEPYQSPMGSMTIDGTVNGEKFSISLYDNLSVSSLVIKSDNFPSEKEECKEKTCDY